MSKRTWTDRKIVDLKVSRERRWNEGQKYIPFYRKIARGIRAFVAACNIALTSNGREHICE